MELCAKDKLIVAFVLPIALAAGYLFYLRPDQAKRLNELERKSASLVTADAFPEEEARAKDACAGAERELAAERAKPEPTVLVHGDPKALATERGQTALNVFRKVEVRVVRESAAPSEDNRADAALDALRASGACPNPMKRLYELRGSYPAIQRSLRELVAPDRAVIPSSLRWNGGEKWTMEVCL